MKSNQQYNSSFFYTPSVTKKHAETFVSNIITTAINNVTSLQTKSRRTSSETYSDDTPNGEFIIEMPEDLIDDRISERMVRKHEIRAMAVLPQVNEKYNNTTIITPNGVFQLNQEIQAFKCIIKPEAFTAYHGTHFLRKARNITQPEGIIIQDEFTVKELEILEKNVIFNGGQSVIGYMINEEIYLRTINSIARLISKRPAEYPPLPEAYSRKILDAVQSEIVFDVTSSLRSALQTYLLTTYLIDTYFKYASSDPLSASYFIWDNSFGLLISTSSLVALNFILLRGWCIEKNIILNIINRTRLVEQSMIGFGSNWINYASLILPTNAIDYGFFPMLILGGIKGYFQKEKSVINISKFPVFKTLQKSICTALTFGSFCDLGLEMLIINSVLFYKNITNISVLDEYFKIMSIIRYVAFTLMMMASIFLYPYNSLWVQNMGRYGANLLYGIGFTFFDNFALFNFVSMIEGVLFPAQISTKDTKHWSIFFLFEALVFLYVVFVSFPSIKNLPVLSVEKIKSNEKINALNSNYYIHCQFNIFTTLRSKNFSLENIELEEYKTKQIDNTHNPIVL